MRRIRHFATSKALASSILTISLSVTVFQYVELAHPQKSNAAAAGWQIIMASSGKKSTASSWTAAASLVINYGSPGTTNFQSATASSSGAVNRSTFGAGEGVYNAFYTQTNITKIALVDDSSQSLDPTAHTNYLVFDLVSSTGSESLNAILKRIDTYLSTSSIQANDTVFGASSATNLTAGLYGYSGLLSASGGTGFKTSVSGSVGNTNVTPTKFAIYGINRDSDNDQQVFAAYAGDLATGKVDSWRGLDPYDTFWSYWGGDFHSNSITQRIGNTYVQTTPGVSTNASWTGAVYMLAYTLPANATIQTPVITGTVAKGVNATITVTVSTDGVVRFFANGKRIANCKDRPTSAGTSATCTWKPTVSGLQTITATLTPSTQGIASVTSPPVSIQVPRRTTNR